MKKCLYLISIFLIISNSHAGNSERAKAIKKLCDGKEAKVVCITGSNASIFPQEGGTSLYNSITGFSTLSEIEGKIIDNTLGVVRPLVCYNGNRIIYSIQSSAGSTVNCVKWDGTGNRKIADGIAGCLWYDSILKKEYVIYGKTNKLLDKCVIVKKNIDNESEKEDTLLDLSKYGDQISPAILTLSKDLSFMAVGAQRQNNTNGINVLFSLNTKQAVTATGGCWGTTPHFKPSSSNDTYWLFSFNQTHTGLMASSNKATSGEIVLEFTDSASGELYYYFGQGKFSSYDQNFYAVTTGYDDAGPTNTAGKIAIIKFKDDYSKISGGVIGMLSNGSMPDIWVQKGNEIPENDTTITLNNPDTVSMFYIGDTINVVWATKGPVENIKIELFRSDKWTVIGESIANSGSFVFKILDVDSMISENCKIKISSINYPHICDSSSKAFIIKRKTNQTNINITRPALNESIEIGDTLKINWETTGVVDSVNIKINYNGNKILVLANKIKNSGNFSYKIPVNFVPTDNRCFIIITGLNNKSSVIDTSGVFYLVPKSSNRINSISNQIQYNCKSYFVKAFTLSGALIYSGEISSLTDKIPLEAYNSMSNSYYLLKIYDSKNVIRKIKIVSKY